MEKGVSPINTLNHKYETMPPYRAKRIVCN